MKAKAEPIAREFVEAINHQNLGRLSELMAEDHVLIDSLGREVRGRTAVLEAWKTYFQWMPDYRIEVEDSAVGDHLVALFGVARGTYAPEGRLSRENQWEVRAAFRAVVSNGALQSWQVYADNKAVYEILSRASERGG